MINRQYCWIDDKPGKMSAFTSDGPVPVIKPTDATRQKRWESVLRWYGFERVSMRDVAEEGNALPHFYTVDHLTGGRKAEWTDWIVVMGRAFLLPITYYAQATKRPLLLINSFTQLLDFVCDHSLSTLLLVAPPDELPVRKMCDLTNLLAERSPGTDLGVVTAVDQAGLSFVLAKLLAKRGSALYDGGIDAIHGFAINHEMVSNGFSPDIVKPWINEGEWRNLVFHAHGEGAHVNLDSVVLCGLTGPEEKNPQGKNVGGCKEGKCKRVHNKNTDVVPIYELKAENTILLSCHGFVVAADLYPTTMSYILSMAEGYTRTCVTTLKALAFKRETIPFLLQFLRGGATFGQIVKLKNDIRWKRERFRPYILFGDPFLDCSEAIDHLAKYSSFGEFRSDGRSVLRFDLGPLADRTVAVETGQEPTEFLGMRDRNTLTLVGFPPHAAGKIVDRTEALRAEMDWLDTLLTRIHWFQSVYRAIEVYLGKEIKGEKRSTQLWLQLHKIHEELTDAVYEMKVLLEMFYRERYWQDGYYTKFKARINNLLGQWCTVFALLIDKPVFKILFKALHRYHRIGKIDKEGECPRCNTVMTRTSYYPFGPGEERVALECPVCGPLKEYCPNRPHFNLVMKPVARRGNKFQIIVKPANVENDHEKGILIGNLLDKTKGKPAVKILKQGVLNQDFTISLDLPEDIGYDLHTLRLIWVGQDMGLVYARGRVTVEID